MYIFIYLFMSAYERVFIQEFTEYTGIISIYFI